MLLGFPTTDSQGEATCAFLLACWWREWRREQALMCSADVFIPSAAVVGPPSVVGHDDACLSVQQRSMQERSAARTHQPRASHASSRHFCTRQPRGILRRQAVMRVLPSLCCNPVRTYIHPSACARISASSPLPGRVRKFEMEGGRMAISCAAGELGGMQILIGAVSAVSASGPTRAEG
ncbi:hypothetical protein BT67DRAFT_139214 [Trichocladium antarcticum]|uniref:Uncharacterized protein n=1 Tax=Trichocladium antarcticum TaxID=1450529 RepID=A0AAN6ZBK4_9PEZI|nr:hypothetical protein BT67DRAFT_139214 [Trichocladium antarcticum]